MGNKYGVQFGGGWRPHWEVRGLKYGPDGFGSVISVEEEEKIKRETELHKMEIEDQERRKSRQQESTAMKQNTTDPLQTDPLPKGEGVKT